VSVPIPIAPAFPGLALSYANVAAAHRLLAARPDAREECAALRISVWPKPGTVVASVEAGAGAGAGAGGNSLGEGAAAAAAAPAGEAEVEAAEAAQQQQQPLFVLEELPALQALLNWELALVTAVEEAQSWDVQLKQPPTWHVLL